jgi:ABC-type amino acid transport substrate-binding protein
MAYPYSYRIVICFLLACLFSTQAKAETALDKIREKGVVEIAVYDALPPFSYRHAGRSVGVDIDIAQALAQELGVNASIRMAGADESMEDDLRNNVWKGHYLGGGVADLMLHVPFDPEFGRRNDRVRLVAPYFREQIVVAISPKFDAAESPLELFTHEKVGVELDTLADFYLLSTASGRIRPNVVHYRNLQAATAALLKGEIAGVMGPRSEIEQGLGSQLAEYRVGPMQLAGLRQTGWDIGAAVKAGNDALAMEVDKAMLALRTSGKLEQIFNRHQISYQLPSRVRLAY